MLAVDRMERPLRRVDAEVEPDRATQHHDGNEAFGRERENDRPHMSPDKQAARRTGHRKPRALQDMSELSDASSHGHHSPTGMPS